ncbi:MAG: GerW family sporulation protein [Lachnospiraceae bacterium]|nr:GerW family sporulation protein [Lachnospiraceae bacterium]MBR5738783.1 GerW family sporulation protein [Lachnospiraceae bacterium]
MAESGFQASIQELLSGLDGFVSSKSVTGEPIYVNDTVIIPFTEINLGIGAGAYGKKGSGTAGAVGAKMTPSAVLIIQNGTSKLISIKDQDTALRVLDMVPSVIDRLKAIAVKEDPAVKEEIDKFASPAENEAAEGKAEASAQ